MSSGRFKISLMFLSAVVLALLPLTPQLAFAQGQTGDVYVMTNQSSGNSVMVFHRDARGMLTMTGTFATGGNGAGTGADPLASQNPLVLSGDNRLLFAVNAGSNSITDFAVAGDQLIWLSTVASGGTMPVSVTARGSLVYVLNAGGTPNISGFTIDPRTNKLVSLAGSTQGLPGAGMAAPAEVSFDSDGDVLVVTEKGTNSIDTFTLNNQGIAQPGVSHPSSAPGTTAFGFAFAQNDVAIVSDAAADSALSSYKVNEDGTLEDVTLAEYDSQAAACWVVVTNDGRFAYTSNTGSGTISSFGVEPGGGLSLLNMAAGSAMVPVDMALSNNSRFLYSRNAGDSSVTGFRIGGNGSLTWVTTVSGLPSGAAGVAAR
jgi:6-phosphogluconolactonase (cycloisomerase 2 family)